MKLIKNKNHVSIKENLYILSRVDGFSGFFLQRIPEINLTMSFYFSFWSVSLSPSDNDYPLYD